MWLLWKGLRLIVNAIPTLAALAIAGGVYWWGHQKHWKLPKFSEFNKGSNSAEKPQDWCSSHKVPESICIECRETLLPKPKPHGWCVRHGIPECVWCNPTVAQLPKTPVISVDDLERADRALAFTERTSNIPNCRTHFRRIQFETESDVNKTGIHVVPVWTHPAVEFLSAPGEIGFDQTRIAHLSARSPGTVWKVFKHLGQDIKAGEVLALIDAAEVGKSKAEVLQSLASLQLKMQTVASIKESAGAISATRVREAEAAVREAEIRFTAGCQALTNLGLPLDEATARDMTVDQLKSKLRWLGIPPDLAASFDAKVTTTNLFPLVSPMDGRVMSREVVAGEVVDTVRILFEVVDTRSLWVTLDLKSEEASRVKIGQTVRFKPDSGREELVGQISWRSSQADLKTRTVKVRADIADPEQRLVANTFGTGKVILREEAKVITVPNEAVQWDGCCNLVFVRDRDYFTSPFKVFHVRKIRIGARDEKNTEVIAGVLPDELVVTAGSGLLLTELQRSSLGEGCACHSKK